MNGGKGKGGSRCTSYVAVEAAESSWAAGGKKRIGSNNRKHYFCVYHFFLITQLYNSEDFCVYFICNCERYTPSDEALDTGIRRCGADTASQCSETTSRMAQ